MAEQAPQRHSSDSFHQRETYHHQDSLTNPNVFSDDFALESLSSASSSPVGDGVSRSPMPFIIPRRPLASHQPSSRAQDRSRTNRGSLEDGSFSPSMPRSSRPLSQSFNHALGTESVSDVPKETSRPHRSISTISNFSLPRTQSPYQGATGPSHPYGMYPQDIGLAHSSSSASHSTIRMPDRSYAGLSGPSQPYGMYPQNTLLEHEASPAAGTIQPTPGFPGLGQTYRRRFGPDGEEAEDLVGPDGYTEQLPPYTRWPNNVPPKNPLSGAIDPIGGTIGQSESTENELRTQTADSQDTLDASHSAGVRSRSLVIDDSLTQLNSPPTADPEPPSEGGHFKERVKQKGRRRVCFGRIPLWLVMVLLFIVAVLLGGVIGGVVGRAREQPQNGEVYKDHDSAYPASNRPEERPLTATTAVTATFTTTLIDAVPFTSSVSLPPLPTGSFTVKLDHPTNLSQTCLTDSEKSAWDCNSRASLELDVQFDAAHQTATVSHSTSHLYYRWGAQPPSFEGGSKIRLMKDKANPSMGPAYYFQQSFDKLVVLRETDLLKRSLTGAEEYNGYQYLEERGHDGEYEDYLVLEERDDKWEDEDYLVLEERGDTTAMDPELFARPGDRPWFCFWNGTILEGFIFVTLDSTNTTVSESVPTDMDFGTSETASAAEPTVTANATQTEIPAPPEGTSITSFVNEDTIPASPAYPTSSTKASETWNHKRQVTAPPPKYPKVVKLEERRNTQISIPQPYCQKMQIMDDGTTSPLHDDNGKRIIQYLNETEPEILNGSHKRRRSWFEILSTLGKRATSADSGCQCQWQIA
ncbi:hypothetical protein MMC22_002816 [Lobaria immixta]|nr:hypothetical protein [Lobaria immixta]